MTPLRPARTLLRPVVSPVNDAARLELLEYFLAHHDDPSRYAHASLEWLARYVGVKRSVVLIVDREAGLLVRSAGYGIPTEDVEPAVWPLDARDPLVGRSLGERTNRGAAREVRRRCAGHAIEVAWRGSVYRGSAAWRSR